MKAVLFLVAVAIFAWAGPAQASESRQDTTLTIEADDHASHGEPHQTTVILTDADGSPVAGETVAVLQDLRLFDYADRVLVAEVRTDFRGVATLSHIPLATGNGRLTAEYQGSDTFGPATATVAFTVEEGTGIATSVIPEATPPLLPRGVTAAWFLPLIVGVWLALGAAIYHLVRIPREGPTRRELM